MSQETNNNNHAEFMRQDIKQDVVLIFNPQATLIATHFRYYYI